MNTSYRTASINGNVEQAYRTVRRIHQQKAENKYRESCNARIVCGNEHRINGTGWGTERHRHQKAYSEMRVCVRMAAAVCCGVKAFARNVELRQWTAVTEQHEGGRMQEKNKQYVNREQQQNIT